MSKTTEEKIDEMHYGRGFYEWTPKSLRRLDDKGRDILKLDTAKKPAIPESTEARTGVVKKFKEKMDKEKTESARYSRGWDARYDHRGKDRRNP